MSRISARVAGQGGAGTSWSIESVTTDRIVVLEPTASADVAIPIPAATCVRLVVVSGTNCADGVLRGLSLPVELAFSGPIDVQATAAEVLRLDLDRLGPADGSGRLGRGDLDDSIGDAGRRGRVAERSGRVPALVQGERRCPRSSCAP